MAEYLRQVHVLPLSLSLSSRQNMDVLISREAGQREAHQSYGSWCPREGGKDVSQSGIGIQVNWC